MGSQGKLQWNAIDHANHNSSLSHLVAHTGSQKDGNIGNDTLVLTHVLLTHTVSFNFVTCTKNRNP